VAVNRWGGLGIIGPTDTCRPLIIIIIIITERVLLKCR